MTLTYCQILNLLLGYLLTIISQPRVYFLQGNLRVPTLNCRVNKRWRRIALLIVCSKESLLITLITIYTHISLTDNTAEKFYSHRYPTSPRNWVDSEVSSLYWPQETVGNDQETVIVSREDLCERKTRTIIWKTMFFSQWHRHTRKRKIRVLPTGVEAMTFRLLVRMLYHWAIWDSW